VQSPTFEATVLPFILRGVNLLGVDSVEIPLNQKQAVWKQLARCAKLPSILHLNSQITLKQVPAALETLFAGGMTGHTLVKLGR
jgi:NADPH:quinone reductase-like Zn-dependent oxidoreductase